MPERTNEEDPIVKEQLRFSPHRSPKKFLKVGIVTASDEQIEIIDQTIRTEKRCRLTMGLIKSYGLLSRLHTIPLIPAKSDEIENAHSIEYIKSLGRSKDDKFDDDFGLSYDCPPQNNLLQKLQLIAGSSLEAAKSLTSGKLKVAINWFGGWHHALRNKASGFCYINDINIAIYWLLHYSKRIFYIDLDLHHGDGVEAEFSKTKCVVTFSVHHFAPGFYPGTGDIGRPGPGYSVNVPLPEFCGDSDWVDICKFGIGNIFDNFDPGYVVVQCGADALFNDPHKSLCISQMGYLTVIDHIKRFNRPMLILGGGGYNEPASAKLWTKISAKLSAVRLLEDIPDDDENFEQYGPDFTINEISTFSRKMPESKITEIKSHISKICEEIRNDRKGQALVKLPSRPFKRRKLALE